MVTDKYYTVRELAQILRRDKTTIYKWIKEGRIKAIKVRGRYLIPEDELNKIIEKS